MHFSRWLTWCASVALLPSVAALAQPQEPDRLTAKDLTALLDKARAKHDVPALAAAIFRGGEKPVVAVVGLRKRGVPTKVTIDDTWHIGSNTKPITGLLTAMLIDRGLLDWDTPLEKVFPEYAAKWKDDIKKITPSHLLTHTAGLPEHGPVKQFFERPTNNPPHQDRLKIVKDLAGVELSAPPGEKYQYSNLGYVLLGAIIDRRGKATWEEQLKKRILEPLKIKQWALGTAYPGKAIVQPFPHEADGKPISTLGVIDNPSLMNATGRLRFSVADYSTLLGEMLRLARGEKGLVKSATAEKMFTVPYPVSNHTLSGWSSNRRPAGKGRMLGHEGSNVLNYCTVVLAVDGDFGVCVMTNQGGPGGPGQKACLEVREELGRRFMKMDK